MILVTFLTILVMILTVYSISDVNWLLRVVAKQKKAYKCRQKLLGCYLYTLLLGFYLALLLVLADFEPQNFKGNFRSEKRCRFNDKSHYFSLFSVINLKSNVL